MARKQSTTIRCLCPITRPPYKPIPFLLLKHALLLLLHTRITHDQKTAHRQSNCNDVSPRCLSHQPTRRQGLNHHDCHLTCVHLHTNTPELVIPCIHSCTSLPGRHCQVSQRPRSTSGRDAHAKHQTAINNPRLIYTTQQPSLLTYR